MVEFPEVFPMFIVEPETPPKFIVVAILFNKLTLALLDPIDEPKVTLEPQMPAENVCNSVKVCAVSVFRVFPQ